MAEIHNIKDLRTIQILTREIAEAEEALRRLKKPRDVTMTLGEAVDEVITAGMLATTEMLRLREEARKQKEVVRQYPFAFSEIDCWPLN